MDDAALVVAARAGDRDALAAIYDRYADRLHDYCASILRDRDEAADAFHDAFLVAAGRLGQLRDPAKLRPWLYAIARHEALRRAQARARQQPTDEVDDLTADGEIDEGARREEAARLVWDAAGGLADRDRALLDLNLRHGLEGQELADAIGVDTGYAYVLLSRLRDQVERSLGALLLSRYGRANCSELAQLLASWDGRYTPLIRKRVARHADGCSACGERRRTLASPLALLSAVPLVPAPTHLRDRVLGDTGLVAHHADAGSWKPDAAGFPPSPYRSRPKRPAPGAAVAAALVLLLGAGLTVLPGTWNERTDDLPLTAAGSLTTATSTTIAPESTTTAVAVTSTTLVGGTTPPTGVTTSTPGSSTTTVGPVVGTGPRLGVGQDRLDFGSRGSVQSLDLHNHGDAPAAWTAALQPAAFTIEPDRGVIAAGGTARATVRLDRDAVPEGTVSGRIRITSDGGDLDVLLDGVVARPPVIGRLTIDRTEIAASPCSSRPTAATVRASATDESGIASVTLRWRHSSAATGSRPLDQDGGTYTAQLGPFPSPGSVTWWVEASDALGVRAHSADMTTAIKAC